MDSELRESQNPSGSDTSDHGNTDMSNFKCKICFGFAHDPIVTLCGHLFCWPCLYKWWRYLGSHSLSQDCPVCKTRVHEEKLVPLYGRGNKGVDAQISKSIPGIHFPNSQARQRSETTKGPASNMNQFPPLGFASIEVDDTPTANVPATDLFTFSATVTPSSGNYQSNTTATPFLSSVGHEFFPQLHPMGAQRQQDTPLKILLLLMGAFGILSLVTC
ncbi:E3 ubiquitin-protein ligase RMA3-like [Papaver somniferum]|uniref:E3 ubiquitin-protein ligase RMA3-like n=1 Tax=Papaver somniferum TaxID=3469 RepID=UPI000E6FD436|nr:E3 ubiquitin-protein ligase RMA3-like [Papaver somniferum]